MASTFLLFGLAWVISVLVNIGVLEFGMQPWHPVASTFLLFGLAWVTSVLVDIEVLEFGMQPLYAICSACGDIECLIDSSSLSPK